MRLAQADQESEISTGSAAAIQSSLHCATDQFFIGWEQCYRVGKRS
jgi:hypothetical protein